MPVVRAVALAGLLLVAGLAVQLLAGRLSPVDAAVRAVLVLAGSAAAAAAAWTLFSALAAASRKGTSGGRTGADGKTPRDPQ